MILKVCGITKQEQYDELVKLDVDMVGFNFYKPSSRYLSTALGGQKGGCLHVGVFVNPSEDEIKKATDLHQLDMIQLHGKETADFTGRIAENYRVIKVFGVDDQFNFKITRDYEQYAEYFLFDTKTPLFGGSGTKFAWHHLAAYEGETPFLLSGGIRPGDADEIIDISHEKFAGVDINSGFEVAPGDKNIDLVQQFITQIK